VTPEFLRALRTDNGAHRRSRNASQSGISLRLRFEEAHSRHDSSAHRLTSLEDLDAHHAYYSDAVQQVLSREQAARINALGTLADFVEVEPQYERLIESLFARELSKRVGATIDDALAGVDYIKSEGLGRGAFLVVGLHGGEERSRCGEWKRKTQNQRETRNESRSRHRRMADNELMSHSRVRLQEQYVADRAATASGRSHVDRRYCDSASPGSPLPISDSRVEPEAEIDDRAAGGAFDEEAVAHAFASNSTYCARSTCLG